MGAKVGIAYLGPTVSKSIYELDKPKGKEFMKINGVPTPLSKHFTNLEEAKNYFKQMMESVDNLNGTNDKIFIKAATGQHGNYFSTSIPQSLSEAYSTPEKIFKETAQASHGTVGVIIEKLVKGTFINVEVFCDGQTGLIAPPMTGYKFTDENTKVSFNHGFGGIGPLKIDDSVLVKVQEEIIDRTLSGFKKEGRFSARGLRIQFRLCLMIGEPYVGIMDLDIIIDEVGKQPQLLEYNLRGGSPSFAIAATLFQTDLALIFWVI